MENGMWCDLELLVFVDKGSVGTKYLDVDEKNGGKHFSIHNFTHLIIACTKGIACIALCSNFYVLLEASFDLVIFHMRHVG